MSETRMGDVFGENIKVKNATKEEVEEFLLEGAGCFVLEDDKHYICCEDFHADYILEAVSSFDSNQEKINDLKVEIKYLTDWLKLVVELRDKSMGYASEWIIDNADNINEMLVALEDDD